jgi:hypothetical protein
MVKHETARVSLSAFTWRIEDMASCISALCVAHVPFALNPPVALFGFNESPPVARPGGQGLGPHNLLRPQVSIPVPPRIVHAWLTVAHGWLALCGSSRAASAAAPCKNVRSSACPPRQQPLPLLSGPALYIAAADARFAMSQCSRQDSVHYVFVHVTRSEFIHSLNAHDHPYLAS